MELKRITLFGLNFLNENDLTYVKNCIFNDLDDLESVNELPIVFTPNMDYLVKLDRPENRYLKQFLSKSRYILPDGQPLIWASRFTKQSLRSRLTGSDLFPLMLQSCIDQRMPILLLTSNPQLTSFYNSIGDYIYAVTLPLVTENNIDQVCESAKKIIVDESTRIVFIGVGFPKQDLLCLSIFNKLDKANKSKPLICLFGASLAFYAGHKKRAPKIYQYLGLEWVYRFMQEPNRLFKRYFIDSLGFLKVLYKINR